MTVYGYTSAGDDTSLLTELNEIRQECKGEPDGGIAIGVSWESFIEELDQDDTVVFGSVLSFATNSDLIQERLDQLKKIGVCIIVLGGKDHDTIRLYPRVN